MFELDSRLAGDSTRLAESELNLLLLMNDQRYPWCILVPKRENLSEWFELSEPEQLQLLRESMLVSAALKNLFNADKINIGALGNIVRQLHVHHIARYIDDPAWPGPVWGHSPATPYNAELLQDTASVLKSSPLSTCFSFLAL